MHPLTTLRRTYSAVSSSLPSSDDIPSSDPKQILPSRLRSSRPGQRAIPRHSFLIRVVVFVLLEFGFIALVSAALRKPIILHPSFTITEVKGAGTALAILWHALAIYAVKDILFNVFSAEWIRQNGGSQSLTLQELDIVSRLTTGLIDQTKHFVSKRATPSFRLGFLSLLLLILLNGLGPSAIGANLVPFNHACNISVANLSIGDVFEYDKASHRASLIMELEIAENITTSGYRTRQPNTLVPWPSSMPDNTTITYDSDVIRYNFSCSWNMPSITEYETISLMSIDGPWRVYLFSPDQLDSPVWGDPTILPLQKGHFWSNNGSGGFDFDHIGTSSLISFLFIGGNASFAGGNSTKDSFIDLGDTPYLLLPCNTSKNPDFIHGRPLPCHPLLLSVLVCNPKLQVLPATINATVSSLDATILSGDPTVKNIPIEAANTIFSSSLFEITSPESIYSELNPIFYQLFLPSPSEFSPQTIKPFSLEQINENMNGVLTTSAKAYLSGYVPDITRDFTVTRFSISTFNASAIMEVQRMALVGSEQFLVASSVVVGLLVIQLVVLVAITKPDQLVRFELENIIQRLQLNYHSPSSDA